MAWRVPTPYFLRLRDQKVTTTRQILFVLPKSDPKHSELYTNDTLTGFTGTFSCGSDQRTLLISRSKSFSKRLGRCPSTRAAACHSWPGCSGSPETWRPTITGRACSLPVRAKALQQGASDLTAGALVFNFILPVGPGRTVIVNKSAIANGVSVTLDRMVVTQSETRMYMTFPASAGIGASDWYADVHVSGAGWDSRHLPAGFSGEMTLGSMFTNRSGEHITTFSGDYRSRHGEWTITVDALSAVDTKAPSNGSGQPKQARVEGPWTFTVSLP